MSRIAELKENDKLTGFYLCREKQTMTTKQDKPYLKMELEDKSGFLPAVLWDVDKVITPFEKGDIVKIEGLVGIFNSALQITVFRVRKAEEHEYAAEDFFRTSKESADSLMKKLLSLIASITSPGLRNLVRHLLLEDELAASKLSSHPAAKSVHHSYRSGLLEHTVSVAETALFFAGRYEYIDRDLVVSGALLHDIGKLTEIEPLPSADYSDEGRLIGHIILGSHRMREAAKQLPELSSEQVALLDHIILSHHGMREYGSPVVPLTLEAMIVHLADNSDSKLKQFEESIEMDHNTGHWTNFNRPLERYIYKPGEHDASR